MEDFYGRLFGIIYLVTCAVGGLRYLKSKYNYDPKTESLMGIVSGDLKLATIKGLEYLIFVYLFIELGAIGLKIFFEILNLLLFSV